MQNKVVKNSIIYTISGMLIKCFNLFFLPVYTAYLTTGDYGITSIATSFLNTMSYIITFSLFSAVMRFYVDLKDNSEKLKRFYGTVVVFIFLSGTFFGLVLTCCSSLLSKYVFSGVDFYPVIFVCLVSMIFNCQHLIYENILRSQQKAMKCSILSIIYFAIILTCNILFVVVLGMGAIGVLLATLIAAVFYTIYFIVDMVRSGAMTICIDLHLLIDALKYSIPIMPHNLSPQIAELTAKALLGGVTSLSTVGIFSIATQFGTIADTIQTYVNNAYGPWLFEQLHHREQDYKKTISNMVDMLCTIIGIMFVGLALFAQDFVLLFMDESYAESWRYIPFVVLKYAIKTPYWFYINVLLYNKKSSKILFVATLTGSIINVFLACVLIPMWGSYGSLAADMVAMVIRVAIIILISRKIEDIGLKFMPFVINFVEVSLFIFGGLFLSYRTGSNSFDWVNFCSKVVVFLLYILLLALTHREQLKQILDKVQKKRLLEKK